MARSAGRPVRSVGRVVGSHANSLCSRWARGGVLLPLAGSQRQSAPGWSGSSTSGSGRSGKGRSGSGRSGTGEVGVVGLGDGEVAVGSGVGVAVVGSGDGDADVDVGAGLVGAGLVGSGLLVAGRDSVGVGRGRLVRLAFVESAGLAAGAALATFFTDPGTADEVASGDPGPGCIPVLDDDGTSVCELRSSAVRPSPAPGPRPGSAGVASRPRTGCPTAGRGTNPRWRRHHRRRAHSRRPPLSAPRAGAAAGGGARGGVHAPAVVVAHSRADCRSRTCRTSCRASELRVLANGPSLPRTRVQNCRNPS